LDGLTAKTKSKQNRATVRDVLGSCHNEGGITFSEDNSALTWNNNPLLLLTLLPTTTAWEILWELYKLNFHFELISLDNKAHRPDHAG
jgi:hypothetical protein